MRYLTLIAVSVLLVSCQAAEDAEKFFNQSTDIYWSDGDSGRLNGTDFRLANVDAPETGGVGSWGGAKCEAERGLGYDAKAFMVALTNNAELEITGTYGADRYGRRVIDLAANGQDVGEAGIAAGHLGAWPHKGQRALQAKPRWCPETSAHTPHAAPQNGDG